MVLIPGKFFGPSYKRITALAPPKPLMLVEAASDESGGDKASWISSIRYELRRNFPGVSTLIWVNRG